jgi:hypothetical protein
VHDLRKLGLVIETIRERHAGEFPGEHARYVLRWPVVNLDSSPANPFAIVRDAAGARKDTTGREKRTSELP